MPLVNVSPPTYSHRPTIDLMDDETVSAECQESTTVHGLAWSEAVDEPLRVSWWTVGRRAALVLVGCLITAGVVLGWWQWSVREQPVMSGPAAPARVDAPVPAQHPPAAPPVLDTTTAQKMADPPIQLDPDSVYLKLLADAGVMAPTPEKAIANGRLICRQLGEGWSIPGVLGEVSRVNPSLGSERAAGTVWAAVDAYCPQYDNRGQ